MKLLRITANTYSYDDFDSIVVACESKEKLQELVDRGIFTESDDHYIDINYYKQHNINIPDGARTGWNCIPEFRKHQRLSIEEIDLDSLIDTTIISASFNAG